jgi:hypothetical protein
MYDEVDSSNKTLPDYQNFRNTLFLQWQELNNSCIEYWCCLPAERFVFKRQFTICFLKFYGQIQQGNKLNHLTIEQRKYLKFLYDYQEKINQVAASKINKITRELMESFGVFDIGMGGDDELW